MTDASRPRLLLVTRYFPPLDGVATMRMYAWAKYLHRLGWDVSVFTTSKERQVVRPLNVDVSSFNVAEVDYLDPLAAMGLEKAAHVSRDPRGRSVAARIRRRAAQFYRKRLNERWPGRTDLWIFPARRELLRRRDAGVTYEYVISSYGPPSAHVIGYYAKAIFGARWIADYRDLWIENHIYQGIWPFTLVERIVERRLIDRADVITTVSDGLAGVLRSKFPEIPVAVIENGFDAELMDSAPDDYFSAEARTFRVVYTGSVYSGRQDPSPLFAAIRQLLDENVLKPEQIEVLFFGGSPGDVPRLVQAFGLDSIVHYRGMVPPNEAHAIQKSADMLLFLEAPSPTVDGILTGKLFEYLYAAVPILAIGVGQESAPARLILDAGAGVVCGEDIAKIRRTLLRFMFDRPELMRDEAFVGTFSRELQTARLARLIKEVGPPGR